MTDGLYAFARALVNGLVHSLWFHYTALHVRARALVSSPAITFSYKLLSYYSSSTWFVRRSMIYLVILQIVLI